MSLFKLIDVGKINVLKLINNNVVFIFKPRALENKIISKGTLQALITRDSAEGYVHQSSRVFPR